MKSWIGFWALMMREIERVVRVWSQTFLPSIISAVLYILVFGQVIGSRVGAVGHLSYLDFILPGLVIMNVMMSAYGGAAFTVFFSKWERSMQDVLVSPMSYGQIVLAILLGGGVLRAVITGALVMGTGAVFGNVQFVHPFLLLYLLITVSILFASLGMVVGLWAERFDHFNIMQTFLLQPLMYLGGVFYSIESLPIAFRVVAKWNPMFYIIDGFRYSMTGFIDGKLVMSVSIVTTLAAMFVVWCVWLFRSGYKLRS